jgi:hypothetical protein
VCDKTYWVLEDVIVFAPPAHDRVRRCRGWLTQRRDPDELIAAGARVLTKNVLFPVPRAEVVFD